MRNIVNINGNWKFVKEDVGFEQAIKEKGEVINLPHTWNAVDGQDGGGDYYRGNCFYVKEFNRPEMKEDDEVYLEFNAVNSESEVVLNGSRLGIHEGGYSRFRFNITPYLKDKNVLVVMASNRVNPRVYPQRADFTFYGGIYRDVNLIVVGKNHFDLDYFGSRGFMADPLVDGKDGKCVIRGFITGSGTIKTRIEDAKGTVVASGKDSEELVVKDVHLWDGVKDPYLYKAYATLVDENDVVLDEVSSYIGFRFFSVDAKKGFFLNGKSYPLRGVSKHQDRWAKGNAVSKADLEEDMEIIKECGANTIRLAHYQHDDYFYELCDKAGMVVWAEIPYISKHEDVGDENTVSQMKELVYQTYNNPSIIVRGLSNEITMMKAGKDRLENHKRLEALVKEIDPHRLTVTAGFAAIGDFNKLNFLTDVFSFNFYFGWYVPTTILNYVRFTFFHLMHRKTPVGLSEYGAEAMPNLHSEHPKRFDNTEEYASVYHEKMLKFFDRYQYLWATHVWNMFDFGSDGRNQGGDPGKNHKGLVTFDRKLKKDCFYAYKAWWTTSPFVHLCGTRFINRTGKKTLIKAYSNQKEVSFYLNDKLFKTIKANKVFTCKMPLSDGMKVEVRCGDMKESMILHKVEKKDPAYILPKGGNSYSWEKKKAGADVGAKAEQEKKN